LQHACAVTITFTMHLDYLTRCAGAILECLGLSSSYEDKESTCAVMYKTTGMRGLLSYTNLNDLAEICLVG
jgi:hypothetical protein